MTSYSNRGNCAAGARAALKNKNAKIGVDFQIVPITGGRFTWSASGAAKVEAAPMPDPPAAKVVKAKRVRKPRDPDAPKAVRKKGGPRPSILGQPQAKLAIELIANPDGITAAALATALGKARGAALTTHTARGLVSRINKALRESGRPQITKGRPFKEQTYFGSKTAAEAAARAA